MNGNTNEERLKRMLYRYMSQELAEELLKRDDDRLGAERKEVSILFCDILSATTLMEGLEGEEIVAFLNEYFESMVEAIFQHQGIVDKYWGDAILSVFGLLLPVENHAWCAVQAAIEMRHRLMELNERRLTQRKIPIRIGMGINSDTVMSGNIGSSKRMEFTVVGNGVSLACRLEAASRGYGCDIVISDTTYRSCSDRIWSRNLDQIRVIGVNHPVSIYEVVGLRSEPLSEQKQEAIEHYHKGREYYLRRNFRQAMNEFARILEEIDPNDKAAELHLDRSQHFIKNSPSADWDGIWSLWEQ